MIVSSPREFFIKLRGLWGRWLLGVVQSSRREVCCWGRCCQPLSWMLGFPLGGWMVGGRQLYALPVVFCCE